MSVENYAFKGHDWWEVAEALGFPTKCDYSRNGRQYTKAGRLWNDIYAVQFIRRKMRTDPENTAKAFRLHLAALGQSEAHHEAPVWRAMSQIEDDWTLLKLCYNTMEYMWT